MVSMGYRVGMCGTEASVTVGENGGVERDGIVDPSHISITVRQSDAGQNGVRMAGAEDAFTGDECGLEKSDGSVEFTQVVVGVGQLMA